MSLSLDRFRQELSETVLSFLWQQWSSVGVMAAGGPARLRVIDPEPLLLLTLEVGRNDPRMFDEVMDWLITNGKWINVVRLSALFREDKVCSQEVLGAVAATLAKYDRTPKWRTLAKTCKPNESGQSESLFQKSGQPLFLSGGEKDATFASYGLLRSPLVTRGMSAPVIPSPSTSWTAANFVFKARALFGVNIRADVFAFLVLQGAANPTRVAKELGYSQRRVQDALTDMASADVFKVRAVGNAKEYFVDSENVLRFLGATDTDVAWFDWRALSRAATTIWRRAFGMREAGLTPYVLESEQEKVLREVKNDLLTAVPRRRAEDPAQTAGPQKVKGLIQSLQSTLAPTPGYSWKRFWVPRDGAVSYADGGYPFIPTEAMGLPRLIESDVRNFESVAHTPCLVLLGEPGMGKSYALRNAVKTLEASVTETGAKSLFLDLRSYASEDRLIRDLFESETFRAWSRGEHTLHVFLDSLDEALLHQGTIANLLVDKLSALPSVAGLHFRIACRTAEWPPVLENGLKTKWGDDAIQVLELVPLMRSNVFEAAEAAGLDADAFLQEVDRHEAVPLAFKPVTLKFLLKSVQETGAVASSQKDLYAQGCRILCEETNEGRIGARLAGKLTAQQRMEVAAHIAATTVFCNRNAVWIGADPTLVPTSDLILDDLCQGTFGERSDPVTREAVMETLSTGLFSSRGPDRLGWAHQTYAEFLAAWHLHRSGISVSQTLSLLVHPGDPGHRLVPQLHETAAWLACMDEKIFRRLIQSDPEVLLRSDVAAASPGDREKLVDSLLTHIQEDKILDSDSSLAARYRKLAYPGLPHQLERLTQQLRPYVLDRSKDGMVRREAIRIATACKLRSLAADLALVALDSTENYSIRAAAAAFVAALGDTTLRGRLKPLIHLSESEDPSDELKGSAVKACWPDWITAEELFQALTPPKQQSYFGAYRQFFSTSLINTMKDGELPIALRWVREQKPRHELEHHLRQRMEDILERAFENIEHPGMLSEFAKTILCRLGKHDELFGREQDGWRNLVTKDDGLRRRIVDALLTSVDDPKKHAFRLSCSGLPLVGHGDIPWLAERMERETDDRIQAAIAHLIRYTFRPAAEAIDTLIRLSERHPLVRELFSWELTPIAVGSETARKLKNELAREKAYQAEVAERHQAPSLTPAPAERIAVLLDRFETDGDLDAWWRLMMELTLEPTSTHYDRELEADITQLPGWIAADGRVRERVIATAKKYLAERDADPNAWFGKENIWHRPSVAGYKALYLLHKEAPKALSQLSQEIWTNWMPVVVDQARFCPSESQPILSAAYRAAPDAMVQWLNRAIDQTGDMEALRRLDGAWDDRLASLHLEKVKSPGLKKGTLRWLLEPLLAHGVTEAKDLASSFIQLPLPANVEDREKAIDAAKALLTHSADGWSIVWPAILQDPGFGRTLFEGIASQYERAADVVIERLTADQVADLYIWLVGQFPPDDDPNEEGAHVVTDRESVGDFRNALVSHLKDRGTPEACQAIRRLVHQFPAYRGLKWMLAQAEAAMRQKTWQPPSPRAVFRLLSRRDVRLVRDGNELLAMVIESLRRLEQRMQGETPLAEFLWDKVPGTKVHRPKDENAFANYVKQHLESELKAQGIIVNREVEIRRGEETDIHIDAVIKEPGYGYERVTVIIEAKGSWNPDLEQAIESQLVERYLRDNACQHGIYLVGWFNSPKWDESDYRRNLSAKFEKEQLQKSLEQKARTLSGHGLQIAAAVLNTSLR